MSDLTGPPQIKKTGFLGLRDPGVTPAPYNTSCWMYFPSVFCKLLVGLAGDFGNLVGLSLLLVNFRTLALRSWDRLKLVRGYRPSDVVLWMLTNAVHYERWFLNLCPQVSPLTLDDVICHVILHRDVMKLFPSSAVFEVFCVSLYLSDMVTSSYCLYCLISRDTQFPNSLVVHLHHSNCTPWHPRRRLVAR